MARRSNGVPGPIVYDDDTIPLPGSGGTAGRRVVVGGTGPSTSVTRRTAGSTLPTRGTTLESRVPQQSTTQGRVLIRGEPPQPLRSTAHAAPDDVLLPRRPLGTLGGRVRGLSNLGNTCYMNSVLQILFHTPHILDRFSAAPEHSTGAGAEAPPQGLFSQRVEAVLRMYLAPKAGALSPTPLAERMRLAARRWNSYAQQDAHEFLRYVLNRLHHEATHPPPPGRGGAGGRDDIRSYVSDGFSGELSNVVVCHSCTTPSHRREPFYDLSVPLPAPTPSTATRGLSGTRRPVAKPKPAAASPSREVNAEEEARVARQLAPFLLDDVAINEYVQSTAPRRGRDAAARPGGLRSASATALRIPTHRTDTTLPLCLQKFFKAERLQGKNAYLCEVCERDAYQRLRQEEVTRQESLWAEEDAEDATGDEMDPAALVAHHMASCSLETAVEDIVPLSPPPAGSRAPLADEPSTSEVVEAPLPANVRYTTATQQMALSRLPPILTLHLKRFVPTDRYGRLSKRSGFVSFPPRLTLNPFFRTESDSSASSVYQLYGVVVHSGGIAGGHYVTYVKARDETRMDGRGDWYYCNDSRVSVVSEETVLGVEAYLLFYELDETGAPSP